MRSARPTEAEAREIHLRLAARRRLEAHQRLRQRRGAHLMLFETVPTDPLMLVATVGTLAVLVRAASAVPAIRASRVDLVRVLRAE